MDFYQILGTWSEGILNLIRYSAGLRSYVLELKSEGKLHNTSTCTQMITLQLLLNGSRYSRMDQVNFEEDSL